MIRLLGLTITDTKPMVFALKQIFGIGYKRSIYILKKLNIDPSIYPNDLLITDKEKLENELTDIEKTISISLKRNLINNKKDHIKIKSFKGFRYKRGLPVRGQRTKTNSQTSRKFVIN